MTKKIKILALLYIVSTIYSYSNNAEKEFNPYKFMSLSAIKRSKDVHLPPDLPQTVIKSLPKHIPTKNKHIPKEYKLVWHDEFDGEKIDTKKWNFDRLGKRRLAINTTENARVRNGNLEITTTRENDKHYTSIVSTRNTFRAKFGYFEVRLKFQNQPGQWAAFWLQKENQKKYSNNPNLAGMEIDVIEFGTTRPGMVYHCLHWGGYGKYLKQKSSSTRVPYLETKDWHTFGFLWTKDKYVFYYEDQVIWRVTDKKLISHVAQYMLFSLEIERWAGDITKAILPDTFFIDYIRVYKKSTPINNE